MKPTIVSLTVDYKRALKNYYALYLWEHTKKIG